MGLIFIAAHLGGETKGAYVEMAEVKTARSFLTHGIHLSKPLCLLGAQPFSLSSPLPAFSIAETTRLQNINPMTVFSVVRVAVSLVWAAGALHDVRGRTSRYFRLPA